MKLDVAALLDVPELATYLAQVEQAMEQAIAFGDPTLHQPISRLLHTRGKRLRPSLVMAISASRGHKLGQRAIEAGAAVELVHVASLVHDDIIDNSTTRWGAATVNSQEGLARAILVGDYLLAKACQQAAAVSAEVATVTAATIASLCDGQARELADQYNVNRSVEAYHASIKGKTASLMAAACRVGGLCLDLSGPQTQALAEFGENFGMAFQLIDDLLDFLSTPELAGKPTGNDVVEGVYTLPLLLTLNGPKADAVRKLLAIKPQPATAALTDMLIQNGSVRKTVSEVKKYNSLAVKALEALGQAEPEGLQSLPDTYMQWSLKNLVAPPYQSLIAGFL